MSGQAEAVTPSPTLPGISSKPHNLMRAVANAMHCLGAQGASGCSGRIRSDYSDKSQSVQESRAAGGGNRFAGYVHAHPFSPETVDIITAHVRTQDRGTTFRFALLPPSLDTIPPSRRYPTRLSLPRPGPRHNPNCRRLRAHPDPIVDLRLLQPLAPHRLAYRVLHVPDGGARLRPQLPAAPPAAEPETVQRGGGHGTGGRVPQRRTCSRAREGAEGGDDDRQNGAE